MSKAREAEEAIEHEVVITDIDIPFWSMVSFMIKWVFASIPAGMIIGITVAIILSLFRR
jgi:ABC-type sugar transport system permease subunit